MGQIVKGLLVACVLSVFSLSAHAQVKVVVIPIAGDNPVPAPQFRIVPWSRVYLQPTEANQGRLEYTADSNPTPQSNWGTVCDSCFAGDGTDCPTNTPSKHAAANAVCMDLGYSLGLVDTRYGSSGRLDFTLEDVRCPDGADSYSDCAGSSSNTCNISEQVGINCIDAKLVFLRSAGTNGNLIAAADALGGPTYTDGLLAGDALCQSSADDAGFPGTYKAWLSSDVISAKDRLTHSTIPYLHPADSINVALATNEVASSWSDLINFPLVHPIKAFENGNITTSAQVRTGTSVTGESTALNCDNWTTNSIDVFATQGYSGATDDSWTNDGNQIHGCHTVARLYCFQQ